MTFKQWPDCGKLKIKKITMKNDASLSTLMHDSVQQKPQGSLESSDFLQNIIRFRMRNLSRKTRFLSFFFFSTVKYEKETLKHSKCLTNYLSVLKTKKDPKMKKRKRVLKKMHEKGKPKIKVSKLLSHIHTTHTDTSNTFQ